MSDVERLREALEHDILFFDSIANHEAWEATGIGNLCRGYASRRRELLASLAPSPTTVEVSRGL